MVFKEIIKCQSRALSHVMVPIDTAGMYNLAGCYLGRKVNVRMPEKQCHFLSPLRWKKRSGEECLRLGHVASRCIKRPVWAGRKHGPTKEQHSRETLQWKKWHEFSQVPFCPLVGWNGHSLDFA